MVPRSLAVRRDPVRGFTLLELLVVMSVLVLVLAVSVPALLRGGGRTELEAGARTMAAALRRARDHAITTQSSARLTIDVESGAFRLPAEPADRRLPAHIQVKLFTARSELDGENGGAIRFFPDGTSTGGRVTLSSRAGRRLVDVDWLTGQVAVREPGSEESDAPIARGLSLTAAGG